LHHHLSILQSGCIESQWRGLSRRTWGHGRRGATDHCLRGQSGDDCEDGVIASTRRLFHRLEQHDNDDDGDSYNNSDDAGVDIDDDSHDIDDDDDDIDDGDDDIDDGDDDDDDDDGYDYRGADDR